jgi:hypothetical protein
MTGAALDWPGQPLSRIVDCDRASALPRAEPGAPALASASMSIAVITVWFRRIRGAPPTFLLVGRIEIWAQLCGWVVVGRLDAVGIR